MSASAAAMLPPDESTFDDPISRYASDVIEGRILAGRFVILACRRHFRDLAAAQSSPEKFPYHFDHYKAGRAIRFFSQLRQWKGEWGSGQGRSLALEPSQVFFIGSLYGWRKNGDGMRRFRSAYKQVARKNGKTTEGAGILLYNTFFDGEPGAEGYSAATKLAQAKELWSAAKGIVRKTPWLRDRLVIRTNNISDTETESKLEPLGRDHSTLDGLNVQIAAIDELHAHRDSGIYDVLDTATGARRQPLILSITTAGASKDSFCYQHRAYAIKVLEAKESGGEDDDPSFLAYVAELDTDPHTGKLIDDWTDEKNWAKANPMLGVSVKLDDLRRKCQRAKSSTSDRLNFQRKHLNIWTETETIWLSPESWTSCRGENLEEICKGKDCYVGVDLSSTTDLTAAVFYFPRAIETEGGKYLGACLPFFWMPEEQVDEREKSDAKPYREWVREGYITATEGNVVDYQSVRDRIKALSTVYNIKEIPIDPWNATDFTTQMTSDNFVIFPHQQGYKSMSPAAKALEMLILGGGIRHPNNPVLNWNLAVSSIKSDDAGNIKIVKPDRKTSNKRVDGAICLAMAVNRAAMHDPRPKRSIYEDREPLVI